MVAVPEKQVWRDHYAEGRGFRPVGTVERALLAEHTPCPTVAGGPSMSDAARGNWPSRWPAWAMPWTRSTTPRKP